MEVPWARAGSGFTLMFEALVMLLCQQAAPKSGRALGLRESLQDVLATRNEAGLKGGVAGPPGADWSHFAN